MCRRWRRRSRAMWSPAGTRWWRRRRPTPRSSPSSPPPSPRSCACPMSTSGCAISPPSRSATRRRRRSGGSSRSASAGTGSLSRPASRRSDQHAGPRLMLRSSPRKRIGAKLTIACFDMPVVLVAREDVAGVPLLTGAAMQGSAVERSLGAGWQRVGATDAKCRGGSGGVGQAGRVLELVDERLEQKDHQEVGQHIRSGGAFVDSWWSLQADQALEPLEAELDAPSQTIEGKHVSCSELLGSKRGHEDDPVGRGERLFGDLVAFPLCLSSGFAARSRGGLRRLLDGNQTQRKSRAIFASDPDRPIDQPACRGLAQLGNKINRLPFSIEPARALPGSAHEDIGAGLKYDSDAIGLQIGTVSDADLALDDRDPIERLALLLIGQLEMAKSFVWKIESTMNAPQLVLLLGRCTCFGDRGRIDDADHAPAARWRRRCSKCLADQHRQPIPTLTQTVEQTNVRNVDKPDRCCPCSGRSQASVAEAIRQDHAQQVHRARNHTRAQERFRPARTSFERPNPAKPGNDTLPILGLKRFESHPTGESQAIPPRKRYLSAYALSRGRTVEMQ